MSIEVWRSIPSLDGYEASNLGRIRSCRTGGWRILAGSLSGSGYRYVKVRDGDRKRDRAVHILVCEAFHGPRPDGLQVRHLDGTHVNNAADNLCWGTASENMSDNVRNGVHPWARKTHCPKGHPYDDANTYRGTAGERACRACGRQKQRAWRERQAAA